MEIVDDQVILVSTKEELEKLERIEIPKNLQIDAKPIVAIIGAGAGKFFFSKLRIGMIDFRSFSGIYLCRYASSKCISWSYYFDFT